MSYKEFARRVEAFEDWLFDQPALIGVFILTVLVLALILFIAFVVIAFSGFFTGPEQLP